MEHVVVTIARQYGSGGRTVGKMLAKDMGIAYYSSNLLKMASEESGISEQMFAQLDEKLKNSPFLRMSTDIYTGDLIPPESSDFVSAKNLFNYQAKVIKRVAKAGSCEFNLARAMEQNSMTEAEMEKFIAKTDRYRAEFYKHYTGRDWTDARNYDLCLNSSKLGFEKCVEEIKAYIRVRF